MKKLLLIPAMLALSTDFAFAFDLDQWAKITQSIGNTSRGGFARNRAFIAQTMVFPVTPSVDPSQRATINQSIGDTTDGGTAINNATIIQTQAQVSP